LPVGDIGEKSVTNHGGHAEVTSHRLRQLRSQRCKDRALDRLRADFGAGRLFHGIDQERQPTPVAASVLPSIESLTHRVPFRARFRTGMHADCRK
jgi:hypothetical protein